VGIPLGIPLGPHPLPHSILLTYYIQSTPPSTPGGKRFSPVHLSCSSWSEELSWVSHPWDPRACPPVVWGPMGGDRLMFPFLCASGKPEKDRSMVPYPVDLGRRGSTGVSVGCVGFVLRRCLGSLRRLCGCGGTTLGQLRPVGEPGVFLDEPGRQSGSGVTCPP
jgi:hypothetical protein